MRRFLIILSMVLQRVDVSDIGRYEEGSWVGFPFLWIGMTAAVFQFFGSLPCFQEAFMRWRRWLVFSGDSWRSVW